MLYIELKNEKTIYWEIGDNSSKVLSNVDALHKIMACGEELELIKKTFCSNYSDEKDRLTHPLDRNYTIPMPVNLSDVIWVGDIAKTILMNIMV